MTKKNGQHKSNQGEVCQGQNRPLGQDPWQCTKFGWRRPLGYFPEADRRLHVLLHARR
jgi:hypothetical protein